MTNNEQDFRKFAEWVADEIFNELWEINYDSFAEIACRKLAKLGIVRAKKNKWILAKLPEWKQVQEPCEDAISRQAVIDAMYSLCGDGTLKENEWRDNPHIDSIIDALSDLPSVSAEKTGRWIEDVDESREWDRVRFYCSRCEDWNTYGKTKYCPGCGAKMVEPQESEYAK